MSLLSSTETILANCEEDGDCLLWTGATNSSGIPQAWHADIGRPAVVARVLHCLRCEWTLDHMDGLVVWQECRNPRCLAEEHMRCTTRAQRTKWLRERGLTIQTPAAIAATTAGIRRVASKCSMEKARAIRVDDRDQRLIAADHGISQAMVSLIKRNKNWRETLSGASVFHLAGAA